MIARKLAEAALRRDAELLLGEAEDAGTVTASRILARLRERNAGQDFTDAFLWRAMMLAAEVAGIAVEIDCLAPVRQPLAAGYLPRSASLRPPTAF